MAFTHLPVRRSVPAGVAAYVLGYLVAVGAATARLGAIMATEIPGNTREAATLGELLGTTPPTWIVGGWLYYNAHFVPTEVPTADAMVGISELTRLNFIAVLDAPLFALYLVPAVVLVAAGFLVVRTGTTHGTNGPRNAGASVALGYVPLFVVGVFVFGANVPELRPPAAPTPIRAIFVGLIYPTVAGAVGGKIAERWTDTPEQSLDAFDTQ